jgi:glycyl-tRNA synthetase beta chain
MTKPQASLKGVLFEIGTEELPATNLADIFESVAPGGVNPLAEKLAKILTEKRIAFGECRVWATPRRLVFHATSVAPAQAAKDVLTRLLPKEESFGPDGQPTEKLLMILKHRAADPKDVELGEQNKREYSFLRKAEPAAKTAAVLPEIFETLIKSLGFPKNMKWDDSGLTFPRPVRSCLCLYGDKLVPVKAGLTRSKGDIVIFAGAKRTRIKVGSVEAYFRTLEKAGVILDPALRKTKIREALEKLAQSLQVKLYDDPFLLNEVNFLVEHPSVLSAPFGEEFLKLPLEVLTVSMARKQRIFGVLDSKGIVQPRFLAVLDGQKSEKAKKGISKNIENILHAKLQDSLFFFREDVKVPLEKKRAELKTIVFLKGAGTMLEKSDRLVALSRKLKSVFALGEHDQEVLERAADLCKADLLSQMVGEFPELQGIIGKYYAVENGEAEGVALAIGEQYLPRTVADRLPQTSAGSVLSLLDKTDLIAACFGLGMEPSSSLDPYGLRRSAVAVMKITIDKKLDYSLRTVITEVTAQLGSFVQEKVAPALSGKLEAFFRDRFKALLSERGYSEELVEAAMAASFERPTETFQRVEALARIVSDESFTHTWKVIERTTNILKGNKETLPEKPDSAVFTEALEGEVFARYEASHQAVREAIRARDFRRATNLYAEAFFAILEQFFEKVFVNAEDLNVRKNRLSLLRAVRDLYAHEVADLSKIRLTK